MASSTILFGFKQIEADSGANTTLIFGEINKELKEYLLEKSINTDAIDGVFDFLEALANSVQEDFEELIEKNTDKKRFVRALTRISTMLFKHKVRHSGQNQKKP